MNTHYLIVQGATLVAGSTRPLASAAACCDPRRAAHHVTACCCAFLVTARESLESITADAHEARVAVEAELDSLDGMAQQLAAVTPDLIDARETVIYERKGEI